MEAPQNANEGCPGPGTESAGKNSSCEGCPNQTACASGKTPEDPAQEGIRRKMKLIKHKVMVLSGKGGVGKSTVACQLALTLAAKGFAVGLCDLDLCGPSVPRMMGLEGHEIHTSSEGWQPVYVTDNLAVVSIGFLLSSKNDAVIWRGPRKNGLIKQFLSDVNWGELDYLLFDTPPGTSDEHLSAVQMLELVPGCDGAVLVTTPQEVALNDVRKEISFCLKTKVDILGLVENMSGFVCPHCKCSSQIFLPTSGGAKSLCEQFKLELLGKIPLEPGVALSCQKGLWEGDRKDSVSGAELIRVCQRVVAKLQDRK